MKNYIDLQSCHATQLTSDGEISKWVVRNEQTEDLYELPKHWSEKDVMEAIKFARKFELIAFNAGIDFMKEKKNKEIENIKTSSENIIEFLKSENIRLSMILEQAMGDMDMDEFLQI